MAEDSDAERERGILSPSDRSLLRTGGKYKHRQSLTNRKADIRRRILDSLRDFGVLLDHRDVFDVFDALDFDPEKDDIGERRELEVAMIDMIAFVYGVGLSTNTSFEQMVESGVYEAYSELRPNRILHGVDVDISDEEYDMILKSAWLDWEDGNPLAPPQVAALMESEEFDDDDLPELRSRILRHRERGSALKEDREDPPQPSIRSVSDDDAPSPSDALEDSPTLDDLKEDQGQENSENGVDD